MRTIKFIEQADGPSWRVKRADSGRFYVLQVNISNTEGIDAFWVDAYISKNGTSILHNSPIPLFNGVLDAIRILLKKAGENSLTKKYGG